MAVIVHAFVDCPIAHGQSDGQRLKLRVAIGTTPVKCRAVRLQPTLAELDRTVVTAVASDPRSELIEVAGDDHAIRILNADSMQEIKTL